jgi:hypothetical protein
LALGERVGVLVRDVLATIVSAYVSEEESVTVSQRLELCANDAGKGLSDKGPGRQRDFRQAGSEEVNVAGGVINLTELVPDYFGNVVGRLCMIRFTKL